MTLVSPHGGTVSCQFAQALSKNMKFNFNFNKQLIEIVKKVFVSPESEPVINSLFWYITPENINDVDTDRINKLQRKYKSLEVSDMIEIKYTSEKSIRNVVEKILMKIFYKY